MPLKGQLFHKLVRDWCTSGTVRVTTDNQIYERYNLLFYLPAIIFHRLCNQFTLLALVRIVPKPRAIMVNQLGIF